jgi:hypothetical protein
VAGITYVVEKKDANIKQWISLQAICSMMLVSSYGCDRKNQSIPA